MSTNHQLAASAVTGAGGVGFTLPYKLFKWADDQDQDDMIEAALRGRLEEYLEQRYGISHRTGDGDHRVEQSGEGFGSRISHPTSILVIVTQTTKEKCNDRSIG